MATKNILKRGFKADAERLALQYKKDLNLHACDALCAFKLAKYLNVGIYKATEFITSPTDLALLAKDGGIHCGWSALTMVPKSGNRIIIYNEFHSEARQQSDLMHELAHIICKHEHSQKQYDFEIPIGMREYNEIQEEEAKCLGSTLQLAKPCLLWAIKRNMSHKEIASHYNASIEMVKYRINITGVAKFSSFRS